jgi:hypothetical protein
MDVGMLPSQPSAFLLIKAQMISRKQRVLNMPQLSGMYAVSGTEG